MHIAKLIHKKVLWLDVSMNDTIIMHVFQTDHDAGNQKFSFLLCEGFPLIQMIAKVASSDQIRHQVQIFVVRESIEHVD